MSRPRNPYVLPMLLARKSEQFKDRRTSRGGSKNLSHELLDEIEEETDNENQENKNSEDNGKDNEINKGDQADKKVK